MEYNHLNELQAKGEINVFLTNAIKLTGTIAKHDKNTILLANAGRASLVYKTSVTTISSKDADLDAGLTFADGIDGYAGKERDIEISFLTNLKNLNFPVCVYLVNGIRVMGMIANFDERALLLRPDQRNANDQGRPQIIYKTAIATIVPSI